MSSRGKGVGAPLGGARSTSLLIPSLGKLAARVAAEEHARALELRKAKSAQGDGRIGRRTRFSNDDIREMRRLHEKELLSIEQLAMMYEAGEGYMRKILTYELRSRHVL